MHLPSKRPMNRSELRQRYKGKNQELLQDVHKMAKCKYKGQVNQVRSIKESLRKKYGSLRNCARRLALSWGQMQAMCVIRSQKKKDHYARKFNDSVKRELQQFFNSDEVSFSLPEARYAKKRFLRANLKEACKIFNNKRNSNERKVALSTFRRYRPKNVKLQRHIPVNMCLCQTCVNMNLLSKALIGASMKGVHSR